MYHLYWRPRIRSNVAEQGDNRSGDKGFSRNFLAYMHSGSQGCHTGGRGSHAKPPRYALACVWPVSHRLDWLKRNPPRCRTPMIGIQSPHKAYYAPFGPHQRARINTLPGKSVKQQQLNHHRTCINTHRKTSDSRQTHKVHTLRAMLIDMAACCRVDGDAPGNSAAKNGSDSHSDALFPPPPPLLLTLSASPASLLLPPPSPPPSAGVFPTVFSVAAAAGTTPAGTCPPERATSTTSSPIGAGTRDRGPGMVPHVPCETARATVRACFEKITRGRTCGVARKSEEEEGGLQIAVQCIN